MHRLVGRTHHITGTIARTTTTTRSTTTKIARTTTTIHNITTTQTMGSTTIMGTARGMLCLTKMAWSISTTITATAKDTHLVHMADNDNDKKRRIPLIEKPFMTHQEIANYFGTSRAAISQIEIVALRKLKRAVEARGFKFEDFFGDEWDIT